jgi:hypothetical protein
MKRIPGDKELAKKLTFDKDGAPLFHRRGKKGPLPWENEPKFVTRKRLAVAFDTLIRGMTYPAAAGIHKCSVISAYRWTKRVLQLDPKICPSAGAIQTLYARIQTQKHLLAENKPLEEAVREAIERHPGGDHEALIAELVAIIGR